MKKEILLFLLGLFFSVSINAQEIFSYVEQMPEPSLNINEFLSNNLKYPSHAKEQNIEGKVIVKFVVDSAGNIVNVTVPRSVHSSLDSESIRVVSMMPKWKPGKQNGKAVNVYYTIPISFKLENTPIGRNDYTCSRSSFGIA